MPCYMRNGTRATDPTLSLLCYAHGCHRLLSLLCSAHRCHRPLSLCSARHTGATDPSLFALLGTRVPPTPLSMVYSAHTCHRTQSHCYARRHRHESRAMCRLEMRTAARVTKPPKWQSITLIINYNYTYN